MVNQLQHHDLHIPVLDDEPSIDEVNAAIKHMGTGTSLDGLSPDILKILPSSMTNLILYFMRSCFTTNIQKIERANFCSRILKRGIRRQIQNLEVLPSPLYLVASMIAS